MSVRDIGASLLAEQSVYARLVLKRQRPNVTARQRSGDCHFTQQNPMKNLTPNLTDEFSIVNLPPLMSRLPENSIFDRIPYIDGPDFRFVGIDGADTERQLTMNRLPSTGQLQMLDLSPSLPQTLRGQSIFDEGYCERARTSQELAGTANPADATGTGTPTTRPTETTMDFESSAAVASNGGLFAEQQTNIAVAESAPNQIGSKFSNLNQSMGTVKVQRLFPNLLERVIAAIGGSPQMTRNREREVVLSELIAQAGIPMSVATAAYRNETADLDDTNMRLAMLRYIVYAISDTQLLRLTPDVYGLVNNIVTEEMNDFDPVRAALQQRTQ